MKLSEIIKIFLHEYCAFFYTPNIYEKSKSYFFREIDEIISIKNKNDLQNFKIIENKIKAGYSCFSTIDYEAGYLFEEKLENLHKAGSLNFYFCKKDNVLELNSNEIEYDLDTKDFNDHKINDFRFVQAEDDYYVNLNKIKELIAEGETYQVNYTVKGKFKFEGDLNSLILSLIFNQSAKYTALVNTKDKYTISISPELFFKIENNKIITQPMKGTISRGYNFEFDQLQLNKLKSSEKDKAENVMIVDLLRNDIGKITKFGSVSADKLFAIEKYETLFQMISEVSGELNEDFAISRILPRIFPCGSITGAPKIRTMQIINELENSFRRIYTGSIGFIHENKTIFNVAIRTLEIDKNNNNGEIGLGSGIVWDSDPQNEYNEVKLKSNYLLKPEFYFELFETFLIDNQKIYLKKSHFERLKNAADYFLFKFDDHQVDTKFNELINNSKPEKKYKCKLILNKWGVVKTTMTELNEHKSHDLHLIVSKIKVKSSNKFLYFKTTNRDLYQSEYEKFSKLGFDEVIFLNENNEISEGSFTNIFIKKNKIWLTSPVSCGLLNGTYRKMLLENENYKESKIYIEDLKNAEEIKIVNSVRGIMKVSHVDYNNLD